MKLTLSEIYKYGECTITSRNFSEEEKLLNSDYVIKCGRVATESNGYNIMAYCRQYSTMNGKPHEIKGGIDVNGSITTFNCSCKAGLSEKCNRLFFNFIYIVSFFSILEMMLMNWLCSRVPM